jgi:hypothetical protein
VDGKRIEKANNNNNKIETHHVVAKVYQSKIKSDQIVNCLQRQDDHQMYINSEYVFSSCAHHTANRGKEKRKKTKNYE